MPHAMAASLVELPDPCLLAVLQYCAADPASLCSAARAHSRLHQAAVLALSSLSTARLSRKQQVNSLLLYLSKHGQHVDSMKLCAAAPVTISLSQLANSLHLTSLHFHQMKVQLPTEEQQDALVLTALPLKQLQLSNCQLIGGSAGLTVALSKLSKMEHLSISTISGADGRVASISIAVLATLQKLTHLELRRVQLEAPFLQPLRYLTGLADVHLHLDRASSISHEDYSVGAGMLSHRLTCLVLEGDVVLRPGALADKMALQHLGLRLGSLPGGAARVAQLLSELQDLQQLTCLDLFGSIRAAKDNPPAAAFSALTASSNLQHLNISKCTLPAGVWKHVFPAGRKLPHLQELDISGIWLPSCAVASAPDGSSLVRCSPGLRSLRMQALEGSVGQVTALQQLSGLRTLSLTAPADLSRRQVSEAVASLTGLRHLSLSTVGPDRLVLFELTQLKHLTRLSYEGYLSGALTRLELSSTHPDVNPVWRQVLRLHLRH